VVSRSSYEIEAGRDYPRDWAQFLEWFPDEDSCRRYLERLRWPDGFVCPGCGSMEAPFRASSDRLICRGCRHQSTVTAGTIFDKTRTPLKIWLAAVWYVTNQKSGVSALGLQRVLGFGSYETAWTLLHRLRRAMAWPSREQLAGVVEVDETFVAVPDPAKRLGKAKKSNNTIKALVAIAVEVPDQKGFGRVRLRQIPFPSEQYLLPFVLDAVKVGACVHTDGSAAYRSLEEHGYLRRRTVHDGSGQAPHETMPGVHRVASLLKRWLLGTHQGAVGFEQLDYYLGEFAFRFNRRKSRSRGLIFYRLLEQAIATPPMPYSTIVARPG